MKLDTSLSEQELEEYLGSQRTLGLATPDRDGAPHMTPLWFVWLDGSVFMNTTLGNATVRNLERDPRATATVDDGEEYAELRGVVLQGRAVRAEGDPRLDEVERRWSNKYVGGNPVPFRRWRNRLFLRLDPERLTLWDFRKIPVARARVQAQARAQAQKEAAGG
jgi:PPOX class probable F420-dependent enzyme